MQRETEQRSQTEITFPTDSPINTERLGGQNKSLFDYLMTGKRFNRYIGLTLNPMIGNPQSRIPNVGKAISPIKIKRQFIKVGETTCCEYWIEQEDIRTLKNKGY